MYPADDNLKLEIWFINMAIRKAFSDHDVAINDITWNPLRGGLADAYFNIHSIQITVGPWQETLYRIETQDIKDYSADVNRDIVDQRIRELVEKYLRYATDRVEPDHSSPADHHLHFQTR